MSSGAARVVLVVGRPAAGKSVVAAAIGACFDLPVVAKDDIEEGLFDTIGTGDRECSKRLGRATFALLDREVEQLLRVGATFVVDAAFDVALAGAHLHALHERFGFDSVQVRCTAPQEVLIRRFAERAATFRHAGHVDARNLEEYRASLAVPRQEVFDLGGPVLEAAADERGHLDLDGLLGRLEPLLRHP